MNKTMKKVETKRMDLNRETAMRLWNKSFGKETKVKDFTGRTIVKGAYNDRGSDYGWNVDHILPQSRGGKTADHNLIVCHIFTNDEKANKFPTFKANGISFEIIKVENHYEIHQITKNVQKKPKLEEDDKVNFMDSASGVRLFKKLKGIQNKSRFVGSVLIRLQNVKNTALIDFIEKFFDEENISYSMSNSYWNSETRIVAKNYNMPFKEDNSKLLDKCILLNTYLKKYFMPMECIDSYEICYQVNHFEEKQDMYIEAQKINFDNISGTIENALFINELVYINTEAKKKEPDMVFGYFDTFKQYDYTYTKLSENLKKEVSRK